MRRKNIILFLLIVILFNFSGELFAVTGLITDVNLNENAIKLKNKWYFLQEKTIIKRNNIKGTINSCLPIDGKYPQWAELIFDSEGDLSKIIVKYRVIQGKILKIDYIEGIIRIDIYKTPETRSLNNEFIIEKDELLRKLRIDDEIVIIAAGSRIIDMKKI